MAILLQALRDVRTLSGDPDMLPPLAQRPFIGLERGTDFWKRPDAIHQGIADAKTRINTAVNRRASARTDALIRRN
jgi:hypothetical protein